MSEGVSDKQLRDLEEKAREYLYSGGLHDMGDFHAMFRNGGVVDLPEVLAGFAAWLAR